jgi:hypothetical protein
MSGDPDWYADNYEYQVPIFAMTKEPPGEVPKQNDQSRVGAENEYLVSRREVIDPQAGEPVTENHDGDSTRHRNAEADIAIDKMIQQPFYISTRE